MLIAFLGSDVPTKDQKIQDLIKKHIKDDARHFDLDSLYGEKLDAADLKKSLIALPVLSPQRLVVIHQAHKLKEPHCLIIKEVIKSQKSLLCILDSDESEPNAALSKLLKEGQVITCQKAIPQNVFDMTNLLSARNSAGALKILDDLYKQGHHPLQILGALIWFWGKMKARVSHSVYKKGLLFLQEADLNIKRSRLDPENAVEVLLVKLSSLIG